MWRSVEQLAFNQVSAEVPTTATSVADKASARPELENSQFFAAQIYH
jgi:hypothetical protein